ncbi:hypothetical protein I79_000710 [Cricetulus griseus]|uniref:Uncharacterized protein n=1 Tax=Cricetulus griseus TaxID=10029 RepID=G3GST9_CRIGR|nr:hypothetical protein I79_000710 [Cricetulus griseus]
MNQELNDSAKPVGQQAWGILLSASPALGFRCMLGFVCVCWGSKFPSSCLHSKHLIDGALSQPLNFLLRFFLLFIESKELMIKCFYPNQEKSITRYQFNRGKQFTADK